MTIDALCAIQQKLSAAWGTSELLTRFVHIFLSLSDADRLKACYELDSNLVFSNSGIINFSYIASAVEAKVPDLFAQFEAHLPKSPSLRDSSPRQKWCEFDKKLQTDRFFALLTDVDDTLLPSADALGIGGCDVSWHRNGTLYPGMAAIHRILRGNDFPNNQPGSRGYSVCLTARPAALVQGLGRRCRRLGPRLSILPGNVGDNVCTTQESRYDNYAKSKVEQFNRYIRWFRGEEFIFFGDTGQGDVKVVEELLTNSSVAFCALHVVTPASLNSKRTSMEDFQRAEDTFAEYLTSPQATHLSDAFPDRVFFYNTTVDLAQALNRAQWISAKSVDTIRECYYRDLCEEVRECAQHLDLRSIERIISTRVGPTLDLWELEQVAKANHFAEQLRQVRANTDPIIVTSQSAATLYVDIHRMIMTSSSSSSRSSAPSKKKKTLVGRVLHLQRYLVQSRTYCTCTLKCGNRTVYHLGRTGNAVRDARGLVDWTQDRLAVSRDRLLESDHLAFTIYTDHLYAEWTTTRVGIVTVPVVYEEDAARCVNAVDKELRCKIYSPASDDVGNAVGTLKVIVGFIGDEEEQSEYSAVKS